MAWIERHMKLPVLAALPLLLFHLFFVRLVQKVGNDPILSLAIAGAFIIHWWGRPSRTECAITIGLAAVLRIAYQQIIGISSTYFGHTVISWGAFLGIASSLILAVRIRRAHGKLRQQAASDLLAGTSFFFFWIVFDIALTMTAILVSRTHDQYLYAFDNSLGCQPSFFSAVSLPDDPSLRDSYT